jgi:hypothetical protein
MVVAYHVCSPVPGGAACAQAAWIFSKVLQRWLRRDRRCSAEAQGQKK